MTADSSRPDPVISVTDMRKSYGRIEAVAGVSFDIQPGEIFGIIGPNGSGKTTTVECIQGLRERDSGTIHVLDLDPQRDRAALRWRIGSQLQQSELPERIKVWEALDLFAGIAPRATDWERLIEQWGLSPRRNAVFANLSGGERQRLLVALALVTDPEIVILDEMTTGLDPSARRVAWELIEAIRDEGKTVVLVTHFMDEAERLCDRIAVFRAGRIVALDTPRRLISTYSPDATMTFTSEADVRWLGDSANVEVASRDGHLIMVRGPGAAISRAAGALVQHGIVPDDLRITGANLEDVFLALSGERPETGSEQ